MEIDNVHITYHRNGVSGQGFHLVTFRWRDRDRARGRSRHMVATVFEEPGQVAVLDIDELAKDNINFAQGNSWRGDVFEPALRQAIAAAQR